VSLDGEFPCRPLSVDQVAQWAALLAAAARTDGDDEIFDKEDLIAEFTNPLLDLERGSLAVYDGEVMAGCGVVVTRDEADPAHDMRLEGTVHPGFRGRGIGSRLLEWAEQAAISLHEERYPGRAMTLSGSCLARTEDANDLFVTHGYEPARWFHLMTRELAPGVVAPPVPDGIEILGFSAERSAHALLVRNEAFADHWGSTVTSPESWEHLVGLRVFRPEYSFVAYEAGQPIGMIIGQEYEAYNASIGHRDFYIPLVATRRAARKRGIASALIMTALAAAKADGFESAALNVDSQSPSGAVGLYERLGFRVKDTYVTYRKALLEG
jgi:mycothiol synthase